MVIRIDVHPIGENPTNTTRMLPMPIHVRPAYASCGRSPYVATFHKPPTALDGHNPQPSWVIRRSATQFLSQHSHWSSNESQTSIDNRLLGLPGPYHRHAIGTFNTCSQVATPRSLTNTGGGYHIENLRIATTLSPLFPSEGSTDPPNGPARSQIIHNNYQLNWRGKQAPNLMSGNHHSTSTITYHLCIAWANDVPSR
jgi:hypothetical protein